jgi:rhodanese-related sulfurtransferase
MKLISPEELKSIQLEVQLLDVREPYEYAICSIGGKHIPMAEVTARISELNANRPICVLCKTGKRAAAVANLLETEFGFKHVMVVDGGITAYAEKVDSSIEKYD